MRYLVDTHALLWFAKDDPQLAPRAREIFLDRANDLYVSAATVWELSIKMSLGKLTLGMTLRELVQGARDNGVRMLQVTAEHAYFLETMPHHHRDPFDRMLVAQAMHERLDVLSRDTQLDAYPVERVWE